MRLRLYHHSDGARVAYWEEGTGAPLVLVHSGLLSHREWEPVVEHLSDRFRVVLPDLPLHGDSEARSHHPYTLDWYAEVMSGFIAHELGPRPLVAGHGAGAEILLHAVIGGRLVPRRLVLMPNRLHRRPERPLVRRGWRLAARGSPAARDLVRHAFADVGGNAELARSWARLARAWPVGTRRDLMDDYERVRVPVLLLWADADRLHPLAGAEEALDLLPDAQLRVLPGTGYLLSYDDPVGVARELAAFCG